MNDQNKRIECLLRAAFCAAMDVPNTRTISSTALLEASLSSRCLEMRAAACRARRTAAMKGHEGRCDFLAGAVAVRITFVLRSETTASRRRGRIYAVLAWAVLTPPGVSMDRPASL